MNNEELETELITLFISMDHPVNLIEFSDKLKDFILLDREKQKQRMKERVEEEWDHKLKLEVQFIQGKVSQDDAVSDLKQLFFLYKNDLKERILALTPETLAMQQKLIRATRKLTEEMSNKVMYGISAITGEQNE